MNMRYIVFIALCFTSLMAEEKAVEVPPPATATACELKERLVESEGSVTIGKQLIPYQTTTGTIVLKSADNKEKATLFFVAYTKKDVKEMITRPIAFCTNGGPGSSSVWLHLGALGPQRVLLKDRGDADAPYRLTPNEYSILDSTDLVFIDPVSTGFSRPGPGEDLKQFHGVNEDVKWVGEFIRLYLTRYNRWQSPKFFIGESYGTTRGAALVNHLQNKEYIYFNGIALVSAVLNFQTHSFDAGNDTAYILSLPTYAATAWYHKKLTPDLQANFAKLRTEVEAFAMNTYAQALLKGDRISAEEKSATIATLSRLTGLSESYIRRANMRVDIYQFAKELLRDQERTVGRFDSRFTGIDSNTLGERYQHDPSADALLGAFTAALNHYVRVDLKFDSDETYKILTDVWPWSFGDEGTNKYLNVGESLREAMTRNPKMRVFVASGFYDLATPYFATDYTFDHLGLDPSLRSHVTTSYYDAGHMMYIYKPALIKFKKDLAEFIANTLTAQNS
jgi:carboxypeptidase C (cathepsin A)